MPERNALFKQKSGDGNYAMLPQVTRVTQGNIRQEKKRAARMAGLPLLLPCDVGASPCSANKFGRGYAG